ncbi:MAG: proton-conducting transporter membrane subunit [Bacillota bacterium]|nr:proton-conducting transporter membrane subunit [Eubacteriales bacterium]MDD3536845.1 proton-conducting transporter membrane subunit [Eubacteriales bacterium]MDD4285899.1 proton-conducting transporter membrane subunit [Eubacteriales bacterium]MDI9491778.1 proton-conducting transporter membrane subunit [Bacillota bacterium]HPF17982.1 proton-conducting transporter membrane subunit [Bacillota bacterium]
MMSEHWIPIAIFLPVVGGILIPLIGFCRARSREIYLMAVVLATSVLTTGLLVAPPADSVSVVRITNTIDVAFYVDGLGSVFGVLVAFLWPLATLYAFEYMAGERRQNAFFAYYTITYGLTLGIAFSANLITLYLFCELLTLVTLPLITHTRTKAAYVAGVKYLVYFVAGATAAFVGIILFYVNGGGLDFVPGGLAAGTAVLSPQVIGASFLLMFFGFGAKAAVFPVQDWLPSAGVAPTPVTALLHAVAVVKSGVFAIARFTYYSFGTAPLEGTPAQKIALSFAIFTITYGAIMAWKEVHFKRRLAYSTLSNLSYMIFGILLLTPAGLVAGLLHMLFHGIMKITLFFVAGAVACQSGLHYVTDLRGYGRRMPRTFAVFTAASLSLMGVAPFCGFMSKWYLAQAALAHGGRYAYLGLAAILVAAVFTAIYLLTIVIRAYFPGKSCEPAGRPDAGDPGRYMQIPLGIFALAMVLLFVFAMPVAEWIRSGVAGTFL